MASTDQAIKSAETSATSPSTITASPLLGKFPLADPNEPIKAFTPAELDMALIELTIEAAWNSCQADLKKAKTATERRKIRQKEMHAVMTATETVSSREAQKALDERIRLLQWGMELGEYEEKVWYSRF
ncbi:hypothetical protein VTL71DRAFT_14515 [Oculimacula yallundae]|uniref:Uncharacterized protein n=1 Tax=Oculimacula yallundae TaxID=86028 RepID=A0ABR4CIP4_9HELO